MIQRVEEEGSWGKGATIVLIFPDFYYNVFVEEQRSAIMWGNTAPQPYEWQG